MVDNLCLIFYTKISFFSPALKVGIKVDAKIKESIVMSKTCSYRFFTILDL